MQPNSTIYALLFLEGGNCWSDIRQFSLPIKRSAGAGVSVGFGGGHARYDWGYGFDADNPEEKSVPLRYRTTILIKNNF